MLHDKSFLCFIPARGGSKGVPNKNIRIMAGKPLLAYPIEAAEASGIVDRIVVSTDSDKIGAIAEAYGAEFIKRPAELATDNASVKGAIVHGLSQLPKYDYVLLMEATSPLTIGRDILRAAKKMLNANADMIMGVCRASPDQVMIGRLGPNESMKGFLPKDLRICPRQERPVYHFLNGALQMGKYDIFAKSKDFFEQNTIAFVMGPKDSIHIDTMGDWERVEERLTTLAKYNNWLGNG